MREHAAAPVSAGIEPSTAIATDRRPDNTDARIRVGIIGATGYAGAELIRLLGRHPAVDIVGLQGRDRHDVPIGDIHAHLEGTNLAVDSELPPIDVVFLALPHGAAADRRRKSGPRSITAVPPAAMDGIMSAAVPCGSARKTAST